MATPSPASLVGASLVGAMLMHVPGKKIMSFFSRIGAPPELEPPIFNKKKLVGAPIREWCAANNLDHSQVLRSFKWLDSHYWLSYV